MTRSNLLIALVCTIAVLAVIAAGAGLLLRDDASAFSFTTVRGETIQMYGQGLYRYEIMRDSVGFQGVDLFVLFVAVPLLVVSVLLYRNGSFKGGLLLTGTLAYFLYNSASITFGYAYNNFFLLYTALFTTSLFATVLAFTLFDLSTLPEHFLETLPRRAIAAFLFVVGASLVLVWAGLDILPALLQGQAPPLTGHTTLPTHALDMGIIAPLAILAGVLLLRRTSFGYLLASTLLIVSSVLGASILALSAAQVLAGALTVAQTIAFVVPFVILSAFGLGLTIVLFRNVTDETTPRRGTTPLQMAHAQARR